MVRQEEGIGAMAQACARVRARGLPGVCAGACVRRQARVRVREFRAGR